MSAMANENLFSNLPLPDCNLSYGKLVKNAIRGAVFIG